MRRRRLGVSALLSVAVLTAAPASMAEAATKPPTTPTPSAAAKTPKASKSPKVPKASKVPSTAEKPPQDAACRYHDPEVVKQLLTGAKLAAPGWPQQRLAYEEAHRYTTGAGIKVAVVDSGVDARQEHLRGRVLPGFDVTSGRVKVGGATDCAAHGTLVAGILAGGRVAGRQFVGVAPGAVILPVRQSWGINDYGSAVEGSAVNLLAALQRAVDSGAKIVNVSVTVPQSQLTPVQERAFSLVAQHAAERDVLIVAATGNRPSGSAEQNGATYPGLLAERFDNVISVSGVASDGTVDPEWVTGTYVSVAAPAGGMPCPMDRGGLIPCHGTSFAAPFVSGTAALVRSRFPELTAWEVKKRIEATAVHPAAELPHPISGYGVVDPLAAVTAVLPAPSAGRGDATAPVLLPPPSDDRVRRLTLTVVTASAVGTAVLLGGVFVVRQGRRRRWRPGVRPT